MYKLYFLLKRIQKRYKLNDKCIHIMQKIEGYIEAYYNLFIPKYYKKTQKKRCYKKRNNKSRIIVSLTSFPKRIDIVWITIESILRQSQKPDEIILWLAEEQFQGIDSLPKNLLELTEKGLTIRFCDDLRSHKKYYYVMQEYPKDIIILADDDMVYPRDTIEKLLRLHKKYPKDICCITGQVIGTNEELPSNWRNPYVNEKLVHSDNVQIFTGSGSLYPPKCLNKDVFNRGLIQQLCPHADDLWLTYMARKNNTKITTLSPWRPFPITIYGTSENSLWYINAGQGKNDQQWMAIKKHYENGIKDSDK